MAVSENVLVLKCFNLISILPELQSDNFIAETQQIEKVKL
jgi:hypothetical protein